MVNQVEVRAWSRERVRLLNELGKAYGRGEPLSVLDSRLGKYLDWYMSRTDPEVKALEFLDAKYWHPRETD